MTDKAANPLPLPPDIEVRIEQDMEMLAQFLRRAEPDTLDVEGFVQHAREQLRKTFRECLDLVLESRLERMSKGVSPDEEGSSGDLQ